MSDNSVSVVIPTYREAANLRMLLPQVAAALRQAGLTGEILVVDDDSRDGTAEAIASISSSYPIRLLTRIGQRGLASAVVHGFEQATFDILVCMDADLSHPPQAIPDLVRPLATGAADFCVGSRYVVGGSTEEDWGWLRVINSRAATLLARPLIALHDPMAGFFALTRAGFERAQAAGLNPIGYKIGLELAVRAGVRRVREIPIAFGNRRHGASKLSARQQILYLRQLAGLYWWRAVGRRAAGVLGRFN